MFPVKHFVRETVASAEATSEKLFCTLIPVFSQQAGCVRKHSSLVSDSVEGQPRDS